jgi:ribosomal protein L11 methyltransferase
VTVAAGAAEDARARMLELFPGGFEELEREGSVQLVAYVGPDGEERLRTAFGEVASEPVADDWAERWRSFHRPVRIGPLWVGPPWEEAPPGVVPVVIDPGRAFGTGAHPTTRLVLELLLELEPGSLLDVGCGSGVVAVAAAKLGFGPVEAIDVDSQAVEAARANAEGNGVELRVRAADALTSTLAPADVAVANIALRAVEAIVPRLRADTIVTAGYLREERPLVAGLRHAGRRTVDAWAADLFRRQ